MIAAFAAIWGRSLDTVVVISRTFRFSLLSYLSRRPPTGGATRNKDFPLPLYPPPLSGEKRELCCVSTSAGMPDAL